MNRCDYCSKPGCHWTRHPEARADVRAWEREQEALREDHQPYEGE